MNVVLFFICFSDIDECATGVYNECDEHASCQNSEGSYKCTCMPGYTGSGVVCAGKEKLFLSDKHLRFIQWQISSVFFLLTYSVLQNSEYIFQNKFFLSMGNTLVYKKWDLQYISLCM